MMLLTSRRGARDRAVKLGTKALMPSTDVGTVLIALCAKPAGNLIGQSQVK
jgi:predicted enzyme related to lactoylglutathione lyase